VVDDPKRAPSDRDAAPGDGATVTAATVPASLPPTMPPGAAPAAASTLPPTMPPSAAPAAVSTLPPTMPGTAFPAMPGTFQVPFGAGSPEAAAPIMATLTGAPVPDVLPPSMPPPERYELGAEIARGGMGRVVEATDTLLGRVVALKEALTMDADVLRRFARETRITARLEHPSIVPLHDAGTTSAGAPYYVMRKISGRPLEHLVAAADTLNQRLVLIPHVVAAAQAIAHAHERGIVHRDIKPSNILVGELGETIVIDWGLAKVIGEADEVARIDLSASLTAVPPLTGGREAPDTDAIKTRAGIVFGTPGFMAPEQLRGHPVTERCDVYALGATLYHLLSRKPPHYAKTADEMMKAAARNPPPPITSLVPGVPAELSTIIEKSLAHDPRQRYADARALAEDLQRFLSGQLVASHHYSPRERFVRFVRKNRVPVIITAAASLALLVIGTIAVTRVVDERDRADAHARLAESQRRAAVKAHDEAVERADRLTLTQARAEVELNPTRAIAMVKPLAEKYWQEVRSIAAAARAHGLAYGLPGPKTAGSLRLSRDGTRALAAGDDGAVRLYDLARRTARVIPTRLADTPPARPDDAVRARFADDERRVVAWRGRDVAIVDAASGAIRPLAAPEAVVDLEAVGATVYWVDAQQALWQLELAGGEPARIPLPERVRQVAPSPDGRFLALYGVEHLLLLDRAKPAEPPAEIALGVTKGFDWSTDGTAFGALVDEHAILGATPVEDVPHIVQRNYVGGRFYVVHGNDRIYTIGPTGVGMVSREDPAPRKQLDGEPVGLREARGGAIVAGSTGRLAVLSSYGDRSLAIPAGKLQVFDAHPRSPYVVGAIEGRLLVWNLDDLEPRRLTDQPPDLTQFLGSSHLLAGYEDDEPRWIDLASGRAVPLGEWTLSAAFASPSGHLACAIDVDHRARLIAPGRETRLLDGEFDVAGFASDDELLLGNGAAGTVHLHDTRSGRRTTLVASRGKLLDLAWNRARPAWAAAMFGDGTLWRRNLDTGDEATTAGVSTPVHLQMARDGTVLFADGRTVRAWRTSGGPPQPHAELPRPIVTIGLAGPGHLLAVLDDDSAWLVDLAAPNRVEETESVGTSVSPRKDDEDDAGREPARAEKKYLSGAADAGRLVVSASGGLSIVDPLVRHTWTLAVQPPAANLYQTSTIGYTAPRISTDGTRVVARLPGELVMWTIAVPGDGAATARWVDSLTNAAIDTQRSHKLIWR
jgi:hypothetical protein